MTIEVRLLEWNADAILAKVPRVLERVGAELGEEARQQISTVQFDWPNPTLRFTSALMGGRPAPPRGFIIDAGKRDIVDRGRLLESQTDPIIEGNTMTIRWMAPYSGLVLRGGFFGKYTNPHGDEVTPGQKPGRDWITPTLQARPVLPMFVRYWAETPTQR